MLAKSCMLGLRLNLIPPSYTTWYTPGLDASRCVVRSPRPMNMCRMRICDSTAGKQLIDLDCRVCVVNWGGERQVHIDRRMFGVYSWPGSSDRQTHPPRTVSSAVSSTVGPFGCRSRVGHGSQGGGVSAACAGPAERIEASSMIRSVIWTYRIRWHVPSSP